MPSRPKKKIRDKDEKDPKNPSRLRKTGTMMTCQRCLLVGHNSRGCKNDEVEKPDGEKRKPARPRKYPLPAEPTDPTDPTNPTDTREPTGIASRGMSRGRPKDSGRGRGGGREIAMERKEASKGIGHYIGEETENSYVASESYVQQIPRGEELSIQDPTQESQSNT